jgi:hypothetical protein
VGRPFTYLDAAAPKNLRRISRPEARATRSATYHRNLIRGREDGLSVRVLVVEDEPKMAALVARGLREDGHAADVAADGEAALWMAGSVDYDAIVLDVMLPGSDGFETVATSAPGRRPASSTRGCRTRAFVLSAPGSGRARSSRCRKGRAGSSNRRGYSGTSRLRAPASAGHACTASTRSQARSSSSHDVTPSTGARGSRAGSTMCAAAARAVFRTGPPPWPGARSTSSRQRSIST